MTPDQLDELEKLEKVALKEWRTDGGKNAITAPTGEWDGSWQVISKGIYGSTNAALIVAARNALPDLIRLARAGVEAAKELEKAYAFRGLIESYRFTREGEQYKEEALAKWPDESVKKDGV